MNNCNIVKDLMPLVSENIASEESCNLVHDHIKTCSECKKVWDSINDFGFTNELESETIPIKNVRDKINADKKRSNLAIGLILTYFLLIIFQFLTRPILLPVDRAIVGYEEKGGNIILTLGKEVAGVNLTTLQTDPDSPKRSYSLTAWTNRIDKYMPERNETNYLIEQTKSDTIYYVSENEVDTVLGTFNNPTNKKTLPRLALNFYVKLAGFVFVTAALLAVFTKKKWLFYTAIFGFSYILTHFLVVGINGSSYQMTKDFLTILFLSVLLATSLIKMNKIREYILITKKA